MIYAACFACLVLGALLGFLAACLCVMGGD